MPDDQTLRGSSILGALQESGIEVVVTVPDLWTSEGILRPLPAYRSLRHVKVCKEDEGVGICAGLAACGKRGVIAMQYTGLLDSINAVRNVGVEFSQPICMLVGLMFKEENLPPTQSSWLGIRILEPILDAMGVRHHLLEKEADIPEIRRGIDRAYAESSPVAFLIGRSPLT